MKLMGRRAWIVLLLCLAFTLGMVFLLVTYGAKAATWATYPVNGHLYSQGRLIDAGDILDRDGIILATTRDGKRVYSADSGVRKALLHLVGDRDGNIAVSLQSQMRRKLTGWNFITGAYSRTGSHSAITTTVDAGLNRTAMNAMGSASGTVGVMNWKTGEILCMVSTPTFDPENPPDISQNPDKYEGVYLNRMLQSSYVPGSIFKMVTAAAALNTMPGIHDRQFECTGSLELEEGVITCPKVHGVQTFEQAFSNSCNIAFATLSVELGANTMTSWASRAGVSSVVEMDGISAARGAFSLEGATEAQMGWAGVGQHTTLVNPLSWLQFTASVANGGSRVKPRILASSRAAGDGRAMPASTADALKSVMGYAVQNNYGGLGLSGYSLFAKSGTAEVGGGKQPHAWFVGFLEDDTAPLAFVVIVENGGAGSQTAANVAAKVLQHAVTLEH